MIASLRIVRPVNLGIIAITMYGCRYFVLATNGYQKIHDEPFLFFFLVLSTLLIAAGGNIINDYFDIKADKVNKPEKLIVGKLIQKRKAILLHWILNGIAFIIAIAISVYVKSASIVLVHLVSINLLWFYSLYFKKKPFIGNFVVAALTGMIPILVVVYFEVFNNFNKPFSAFHEDSWSVHLNYNFIYILALMAFIQNLAREILKDVEDIEGDKKIAARTVPMILGVQRTKVLVAGLLIFTPLLYFFFLLDNQFPAFGLSLLTSICWMLASLIDVAGFVLLAFLPNSEIRKNHLLIKLSMFFGILTTFHVAIEYFLFS
jgi:4-hydroxybenzoate polyprenyltransferase